MIIRLRRNHAPRVFVCLVFMLVGARQAYAVSLHNNNPLIEHELKAGEAIQGSVELFNNSKSAVDVTVYIEDWRYSDAGDGSKTFAAAQTLDRSSAGWVSYFPRELSIPAGGRGVVDYTLRVPQDASLNGGYYSVLFFESTVAEVSSGVEEGASIRYAARLGSLIHANVSETVVKVATLSTPSIHRLGGARQKMYIKSQLSNEGNVLIKCKGSFHVMTQENLVAGRGELPARYVWSGDTVPVEAEWAGSLSSGSYSVILTYDCGEDLILVGETTLTEP